MKCKHCDGTGTIKGWISEPCAYCGGTGKLPNDFSEMTKLKRCKKCGGEAVFSGVFDDPKTYRFPECIECGARAEGNSVKDSWYERARKWNEQNTMTHEEWFNSLSTEEKAKYIAKSMFFYDSQFGLTMVEALRKSIEYEDGLNETIEHDVVEWLKEKHNK